MTQKEALDILKLGYNVYLTGQAGSGKTFLLNKYISYLKKNKVNVAITASTGIAATHMNGVTIHSWSGLGVKEKLTDNDIQKLLRKLYLRKRFLITNVLIIDEISMLHSFQLDFVNRICQAFKKNLEPFGGMQIICSGDFFQLPPVQKNKSDDVKFVTESEVWHNMDIKICYLQEQHRHRDPKLSKILADIRNNNINDESLKLLLSRENKEVSSIIKPTKLYTHNIDVDAINNLELDKIKGKEFVYNMHSSGKIKLVELLKKSCLVPEELVLKKDAKVMFLKNNFDKGYVNGTLGKVVGFGDNEYPIVKTFSGKKIIATPASWTIEEGDVVKAKISQIPLRLAWAITVHKSQGMTLDAAEIDLSKAFGKGMGYVALSRVKMLEGIKLMGFNEIALEVNSKVINLEKDLLRQSEEAQQHIKTLGILRKKSLQKDFIQNLRN